MIMFLLQHLRYRYTLGWTLIWAIKIMYIKLLSPLIIAKLVLSECAPFLKMATSILTN